MRTHRLFLLATAALLAAPVFAQSDAQCIVAGRLNGGLWAPLFTGVHLFGADGRPLHTPTRAALSGVRRATLDAPALLSRCDGDAPLARGDDEPPGRKAPAPAIAAGDVVVEGVAFPKLRTGGELVELRVRVPAERVVMVTR
jgi:hypothetical protein